MSAKLFQKAAHFLDLNGVVGKSHVLDVSHTHKNNGGGMHDNNAHANLGFDFLHRCRLFALFDVCGVY